MQLANMIRLRGCHRCDFVTKVPANVMKMDRN